jgi:hypothetical protein
MGLLKRFDCSLQSLLSVSGYGLLVRQTFHSGNHPDHGQWRIAYKDGSDGRPFIFRIRDPSNYPSAMLWFFVLIRQPGLGEELAIKVYIACLPSDLGLILESYWFLI